MKDGWPRAILFDLDDTILVYNGVADDIWRAVCASVGPRLGGRQGDEVLEAVREYRLWYWSDPGRHRQGRLDVEVARLEIAAGALARLGIDDLSLAEEMAQACAVQEKEAVRPSPGALETLRRLRSGGVRLALVTNGDGEHQRHKVDRFGLGWRRSSTTSSPKASSASASPIRWCTRTSSVSWRRSPPRHGWWGTTWSGRWRPLSGWGSSPSGWTTWERAYHPPARFSPTASYDRCRSCSRHRRPFTNWRPQAGYRRAWLEVVWLP